MPVLMYSHDSTVTSVVEKMFKEINLDYEIETDSLRAMGRLWDRTFDAVIVDCDDESGRAVMQSIRENKAEKTKLVAVTGENTPFRSTRGANFIVHKPIFGQRAIRGLQACLSMLTNERRDRTRCNLNLHVLVETEYGKSIHCRAIDLSPSGMSLQSIHSLYGLRRASVKFSVPGCAELISAHADTAWYTDDNRIGLVFKDMRRVSREKIRQYLEGGQNQASPTFEKQKSVVSELQSKSVPAPMGQNPVLNLSAVHG